MKNKRLIVKKLSRWPQSDESDELKFDTGLNVVVGEPHTGKSQWLKMFSFLMGDRDSNPSNAFDETLVNKYESIRGEFLLGNQSFVLQRSWKVRGQKTKVLVNDEPVSVDDFSSHILSKLDIPILQYPQGNPLSPRTWPTLSLQSLFRHIYRRQKSWDELASKQPVVEQYACLLQLLGIAKYRFSPIYKELVDKQKEIYRKQISRGQFISTLERISEEILDEQSLQTQLTSDSLKDEFTKLEEVTEKLIEKRTELLASFKKRIALKVKEVNSSDFAESEERLETLTLKREETLSEINRTRRRSSDLGQYAQRVSEELSRIERARSAGKVFRDLKITHCPACEQSVSPKNSDPDHCFLCGQEIIEKSNESNTSEQRLDFEIEQLNAENEEAQELVEATTSTLEKLLTKQKRLDEEIALVKGKMRVTQLKAASYLPQEFSQEISQIDIDLGRNQEKIK